VCKANVKVVYNNK